MAKLTDTQRAASHARPKTRRSQKHQSRGARRPNTEVTPVGVRPGTKQALLIDLLRRKKGATIAEIVDAIGWQAHSVRGAISGTLKKKFGLTVTSESVENRGRVYRVVERG